MIPKRKISLIYLLLVLLLVGSALLSLSIGDSGAGISDVIAACFGRASTSIKLIIFQIRLPRILACLLAGASLALSGLSLQTLTRNPLADSGILGINAGAGIVVALLVSVADISSQLMLSLMPFLAMMGGFLTLLIVYLVARKPTGGLSPVRLIIAGVGISTMLSGTMVSIVGNINRYKVDYITNWLSGRMTGDNWQTLTLMAPLFLLLWLLTYSRANKLNLLNLNDQTTLALGLSLNHERLILLILSSCLAGFSVVLVGNVTFVGLVAGHISRRWLGANHRLLIPAVMLIGMLILLVADTIGRVLLVGTGIPTGLIVSIIGAPYFLYLMLTTKN